MGSDIIDSTLSCDHPTIQYQLTSFSGSMSITNYEDFAGTSTAVGSTIAVDSNCLLIQEMH